jgi:DNA-binding LytR/AlgR family response regulator
MKNLEIFINPASGRKAIYIIARAGHKVIDLEKILLCKADRNYTIISLEDGKKIDIPKSLCILESVLKRHNFLRCNSSYLINLCKIGSFNRYLKKIYLSDHEISMPKERCHEIFPVLTSFGFKEVIRRCLDN